MTKTAEQLKITLTRGLVGKPKTQILVVRALGLGKYGSSVVRSASPTINGMLRKVHHLVTVSPAEEGAAKAAPKKAASRKAAPKVAAPETAAKKTEDAEQ
jgi:large subunit ribosomal protein L30